MGKLYTFVHNACVRRALRRRLSRYTAQEVCANQEQTNPTDQTTSHPSYVLHEQGNVSGLQGLRVSPCVPQDGAHSLLKRIQILLGLPTQAQQAGDENPPEDTFSRVYS